MQLDSRYKTSGVYFVLCNGYLRIGLASQRRTIIDHLEKFRVPDEISPTGEDEAILLGAVLTDEYKPQDLYDAILGFYNKKPVASVWYKSSLLEAEQLISDIKAEGIKFTHADVKIEYNHTKSVAEPVCQGPLRVDLPEEFHQPGLYVVRVGKFVKLGYDEKWVRRSVNELRLPLFGRTRHTRAFFKGAFLGMSKAAAGLVRERLKHKTIVGGDWYELSQAELDQIIARTGYPFTAADQVFDVESDEDEVHDHDAPTGVKAKLIEARKERKREERALVAAYKRKDENGLASNKRSTDARNAQRNATRERTKTRRYYTQRKPVKSHERARKPQYDVLIDLGATVNISEELFLYHFDRLSASSAIDTQMAGVRQVIIEPIIVPDEKTGPHTKAESKKLIAKVRS